MENNLPIYEALLTDVEDGILAISLVDEPAVESDFVAFKNDNILHFSIQDDKEHMLLGVVMRADFPIYRYDKNMGEYYIRYSKQTIAQMAQKMMADANQNKVNLMHQDDTFVEGVELVQLFIKDIEKGINPQGFESIEDGSLFAQYKVNNEEIWKSVQDGTFKGFSLEGYFSIERVKNNVKNKKSIMKSIKETLRALLISFSETMTDKGNLYYEGDELIVNIAVTDADGEPIADGEYETETQIIVVEGGIVKEIKDKEVEEPEVEEVVEETLEEVVEEPTEETETVEEGNAEIDELKAEIEALKAEIEGLKSTIENILEKVNAPMAEPIVEEFSKINQGVDWANIRKVAREWK